MTEEELNRSLMYSIREEDFEEVKNLIGMGANINGFGGEIMLCAVVYQNKEILDYVISKGADLNYNDQQCFKLAINMRLFIALDCFMRSGVDFSKQVNIGVINSIHDGHDDMTRYLLEKCNGDPTYENNRAMSDACSNGNIEIVKLIYSMGVKPDVDIFKDALFMGKISILEYFIEECDFDYLKHLEYFLDLCVSYNEVEGFNYLIDKHFDKEMIKKVFEVKEQRIVETSSELLAIYHKLILDEKIDLASDNKKIRL